MPPPRTHRHRYYGVLAPNSPLRGAVTAMAQMSVQVPACMPVMGEANAGAGAQTTATAAVPGGAGGASLTEPPAKPKTRPSAHYLWAALIARIYEVFPLICPHCGAPMRIIAFITFSADIQKILEHIGVEPQAPRIAPARGPPLWDDCGAQDVGDGVEALPDWDLANQSPPDYPDDQRKAW